MVDTLSEIAGVDAYLLDVYSFRWILYPRYADVGVGGDSEAYIVTIALIRCYEVQHAITRGDWHPYLHMFTDTLRREGAWRICHSQEYVSCLCTRPVSACYYERP